MTDMTVKIANMIPVGNEAIINGGVSNLGHARGNYVTEKISDDQWRVTKLAEGIPGRVARVLVFLRRHGPLLVAGDEVWSEDPRARVKGITRRMVEEAVACRPRVVCMENARVTMTDRGRGFFRPQERLVFSVPADMVEAVTEAVNHVLDRHHQ